MPFHPIAVTVEVAIKSTFRGNERANIIHYNYGTSGRPTVSQLSQLCDAVYLGVVNKMLPLTNTECHFYEVTARDMEDANGAQFVKNVNIFGTNAQAVAPGNVSVVLSKRSGIPGRSNRGRLYTHDLPEGEIDGDNVRTTLINWLIALGAEMLVQYVAGKFVPAIGSRLGAYSSLMTSVILETITDSQYRRLATRGS